MRYVVGILALGGVVGIDEDVLIPFEVADRSAHGPANRNDSGKGTKTRFNFVVDGEVLLGWDGGELEIGVDEEDVAAIETEVESGQFKHAVQEETGDDEENQGKRELRSDDPFAGTETQAAIGLLSLAALHGGGEGNASGAEGRKNSEENASEDGDGDGERENAGVDQKGRGKRCCRWWKDNGPRGRFPSGQREIREARRRRRAKDIRLGVDE